MSECAQVRQKGCRRGTSTRLPQPQEAPKRGHDDCAEFVGDLFAQKQLRPRPRPGGGGVRAWAGTRTARVLAGVWETAESPRHKAEQEGSQRGGRERACTGALGSSLERFLPVVPPLLLRGAAELRGLLGLELPQHHLFAWNPRPEVSSSIRDVCGHRRASSRDRGARR